MLDLLGPPIAALTAVVVGFPGQLGLDVPAPSTRPAVSCVQGRAAGPQATDVHLPRRREEPRPHVVGRETTTGRSSTVRPPSDGDAAMAPADRMPGTCAGEPRADRVAAAGSGGGSGPMPRAGAPVVPADTWYRLGTGMETNVSGVAMIQAGAARITALIARDNKQADENRLSTVTFVEGRAPVVTPVEWHGEVPADIEGIDAVPGRAGRFATLTSSGTGQMITVDASGVTVDGTFVVPDPVSDPKYEGFALATLAGRTVAVWADRGQDDSPATIFAAPFDVDTRRFGAPVRMEVTAPYPRRNARDVSDIKITSDGTLLATSASEGSDDGPFAGAVHVAGTVATVPAVSLTPPADPRLLLKLGGRKVEAIACAPPTNSCVLGADNENKGGSLRMVTLGGPEPRAAR